MEEGQKEGSRETRKKVEEEQLSTRNHFVLFFLFCELPLICH